MIREIKDLYRTHIYNIARKQFNRALKEGDYVHALYLAERNHKEMMLSKEDIDELNFSFGEYNHRISRLKQRIDGVTSKLEEATRQIERESQ